MQDGLFRDLLFIRQKKTELKAHIKMIEEGILPIQAEVQKCDDKEKELQAKIMEGMNKEGIGTKEYDGHKIIKAIKKSIKIVDEQKLLEALRDKYIAPLKRIVGKTYDGEIHNALLTLKGKNIWSLDTKNLENQLKKDVRIKNIKIERVLPSKLKISIEEEKPYIKVKKGEKILVANENGEIFSFSKELAYSNLITVDGSKEEILKNRTNIVINKDSSGIIYI